MLWKKFYSANWSVSLEYFSFYLIIFNYLNFVFDIRKHHQYLLYIFDIRISNNFIRDLEILYNSPAIFLIHSSYRSYRSPRPFIKIRENLRFNFEKNYSPWMVALLRSVEKKSNGFAETVSRLIPFGKILTSRSKSQACVWIPESTAIRRGTRRSMGSIGITSSFRREIARFSCRRLVRLFVAPRETSNLHETLLYTPCFKAKNPPLPCSFPCMRSVNRFRR